MGATTSAHQIRLEGALDTPPQEFWDLMEQYRRDLVQQALGLIGNREDAEDVAQETFYEAFRLRAELDRIQSLGAWLRTINHSNAIDRIRTQARERGKSQRKQRELPGRMVTTGGFSALELREAVTQAIEVLPEELRSAVVLRYWEHLTYDQIAERLGVAAITVRRRLFEACLHLYRHTDLKGLVSTEPIGPNRTQGEENG